MRGHQRKGQRRQQNFGEGYGAQGGAYGAGQYGNQYGNQGGSGGYGGSSRSDRGRGYGQQGYGQQGYGSQSSHQYPGAGRSGGLGSQTEDPRSYGGGRGEDVWERNTGGYPDSGSYLANEGEASRYPRGADQYDLGGDYEQGESMPNERYEGAWYGQGSSRGSGRGWEDQRGGQGGGRGGQGSHGGGSGQESWYGNQASYGDQGSSRGERRSGQVYPGTRSGSGSEEYGDQGWGRPQQGASRSWDTMGGPRPRGVAPKGYKKSDQRLTEDLGEALMDEGIDCGNVEVQVKDGVVTITGEITDRSDKYRIEHVAAGMMGVQDVDNQLRVAKSSSQTESKPGRTGEGQAGSAGVGGAGRNDKSGGRNH